MRRHVNDGKVLAALVLAGLVVVPVTLAAMAAPPGVGSIQRQMGGPGGMMGGPGGMMGGPGGMMGGPGGMMGGMARVESEFDFLTQMIPHHEEAVASARVLLAGTERPAMKAFAERIIQTQSAEVVQMQEWLAAWYPGRDTTVDHRPMMRDLAGLTGDELDRAFLEDMIRHHMMAVMMSQQLVAGSLAEHPQVVSFARSIRDGQRAEIGQMAGWLRDWFGAGPMGSGRCVHERNGATE